METQGAAAAEGMSWEGTGGYQERTPDSGIGNGAKGLSTVGREHKEKAFFERRARARKTDAHPSRWGTWSSDGLRSDVVQLKP